MYWSFQTVPYLHASQKGYRVIAIGCVQIESTFTSAVCFQKKKIKKSDVRENDNIDQICLGKKMLYILLLKK